MNPKREELINMLIKSERPLWRSVAKSLKKRIREVNLSRINKYSKKGDIILVPGKVLGGGDINHKVTIAAFLYTKNAIEKLKKSKSKIMSIEDLYKTKPKKVILIG